MMSNILNNNRTNIRFGFDILIYREEVKGRIEACILKNDE